MLNVERITKIYALREKSRVLRSQLFSRKSRYQYLNLLSIGHPTPDQILGMDALRSEITTLIEMLEPIFEELEALQTRYCVTYQETFDGAISDDTTVIKNFAGDIDGEIMGADVDRSSADYEAVYQDLLEFVKDLSPYTFIRSVKKC